MQRVLAGYEAFNRGDLDAASALWHPEVEWTVLDLLPESEVYHGHEEVMRFFRMWRESFEDFRIDIEETIDDGERIVVVMSISGSGRGSGAEVRTPTHAQIWTFDGDLAVRIEMLRKSDALARIGRGG